MVLRLEEFSKEVALGFSGVGFLYRTKVQKPPNGRTAEPPPSAAAVAAVVAVDVFTVC